uniref:(northern house mosquito) hypothetical protein n=1 Tax=Culex pipiens TaxID=7175 RepID=A0A8D8A912_CULPI
MLPTRSSNRVMVPFSGSNIRWFFCNVISPFLTCSPRERSRCSCRSSLLSSRLYECTSDRMASRISWFVTSTFCWASTSDAIALTIASRNKLDLAAMLPLQGNVCWCSARRTTEHFLEREMLPDRALQMY